MLTAPNPARFVSLSKASFKKNGLFLNAKKVKQIKSFPKNELTELMFRNLDLKINDWMNNGLDFNKMKSISRGNFEGFAAVAFQYKISSDKKLLKILNKKLNIFLWNVHKTGRNPLDMGHLLISLSLVYHWLEKELSPSQKRIIKATVLDYATELYSKTKTPLGYWAGTPLHNIAHCAWTGIGLAGISFSFEIPEAKFWFNDAFHYFNLVSWLQAEDGSLIEGPSYSAYEAEMRPLFYLPCQKLLKENLFAKSHMGIADFFTHLNKPFGEIQNHLFPWGDSGRSLHYHSPTNLILGLASNFKSSKMQSLAYRILKQGFTKSTPYEWLNLAFYDPRVLFDTSFKINTDHHFPELGLIASRSDWSENATAISFKCGPFQGHQTSKKFDGDPGCSHCHADAASFQVYSRKSEVLVDPGYEYFKRTSNHNTVVINGLGQLGEGTKWFDVNRALHYQHFGAIVDYKATQKYSYWTADATKTYLPELKLTKFLRTVIFIKPDIILVYDDLESEMKSQFQWQWHTLLPFIKKSQTQAKFSNENVQLNINLFGKWPMDSNIKTAKLTDLVMPFKGNSLTFKNKKKTTQMQLLTVIHLANPSEKNTLQFSYQKNLLKITTENQTYKINLSQMKKRLVISG